MSEDWKLTDAARKHLLNSLSAQIPGLCVRGEQRTAKYMTMAWERINELEKALETCDTSLNYLISESDAFLVADTQALIRKVLAK